jgi:flagellar basal body-associated protein FliL
MREITRRGLVRLAALGLCVGFTAPVPAWAEEGEEKSGPPKPAFLSLGEFTVNLKDKDGQFNFVVVSVTLDLAPDQANALRDIQPRLKEAITRRLMLLADRGALAPGETDPTIVKASLSDALQKVAADGIREVLITRLLYG